MAGRAGHQVDWRSLGALCIFMATTAAAMTSALKRRGQCQRRNTGYFSVKADAVRIFIVAGVALEVLSFASLIFFLLAIRSLAMMADAAVLQEVLMVTVRKIRRIHRFFGAVSDDEMLRPLILLGENKTCASQQSQSCAQNKCLLHDKIF